MLLLGLINDTLVQFRFLDMAPPPVIQMPLILMECHRIGRCKSISQIYTNPNVLKTVKAPIINKCRTQWQNLDL